MDLFESKTRIGIINNILKVFDVSIDNMKYDMGPPSENSISFSKFLGDVFLVFKIGAEKCELDMNRITTTDFCVETVDNFRSIFSDIQLSRQKVTIQTHFSVDEGAEQFIDSISPPAPVSFEGKIAVRGVIYSLNLAEKHADLLITVADSMLLQDGVFLQLAADFQDNSSGALELKDEMVAVYNYILNGFNAVLPGA